MARRTDPARASDRDAASARPLRLTDASIVVTGLGAVTAWGWGVEPFRAGALSGRTAIGRLDRFEGSRFPTRTAGQVPEPPRRPAVRSRAGSGSLADRFALAAASEAVGQAGLDLPDSRREVGLWFGSSTGGLYESEEFYRRLLASSFRKTGVAALGSQQVGCPGEYVARRFGITGPVATISSACSSGTLAIAAALEGLREGRVDVAIAGGADSLARVTYGGFNSLRAVDAEPCRPFREDRAGLSLGEGAAVLVLESWATARCRGAVPLAVLRGAGASTDAHHMTAPDPEGHGAARALRAALDDAGLRPDDVDFINAHGTGTRLNDTAEARAFAGVFGDRAREIPVTATKASVGHLLGSAGSIEAVATVLALRDGHVPGTAGPGRIDPEIPVRLVREGEGSGPHAPAVGVSLNLAFGGCNGALVFERFARAGNGREGEAP